MSEQKEAGLQGIVARQSAISTVGVCGIGLNYRDRKFRNLTYKCSLEEVTYQLLKGQLPNLQQHDELKSLIQQKRQIPQHIEKRMIEEITFMRILTFIVLVHIKNVDINYFSIQSAYYLVYYILYDELQDGEDRLLNKES